MVSQNLHGCDQQKGTDQWKTDWQTQTGTSRRLNIPRPVLTCLQYNSTGRSTFNIHVRNSSYFAFGAQTASDSFCWK